MARNHSSAEHSVPLRICATDATGLERGEAREARGAVLRELHALLKSLDPASKFGGLIRMVNKRQEFLWVHPMYEKEY